MRLIKLLAYSLLGYVIYELWKGMREGELATSSAPTGRSSDLQRALNDDTGRMMNMTGTGRGTRVTTEDASGTSVPHVVGRGVTQ
jgi:hypothetical protein